MSTACLLARVNVTVVNLCSQFLIPGFVDTHTHAPQYSFTGTGYDLPLLQWLQKYTFPVESRFRDTEFARQHYPLAVVSGPRRVGVLFSCCVYVCGRVCMCVCGVRVCVCVRVYVRVWCVWACTFDVRWLNHHFGCC